MFIFAIFADVLVKILELDYNILNDGYFPANGWSLLLLLLFDHFEG